MAQDQTAPADSEHGSFVAGFTIGMLASVTAYLVAKSEGGQALRRQIKDEWTQAVDRLEPLIESISPAHSATETRISQVLRRFFEEFVEWEQPSEKTTKTAKTAAKKVVKKSSKRTFTGT